MGKEMTMKTTKLLDAEAMLAKLVQVNGDAHLRQKFYPRLTKLAGYEMVAPGLVMALQLAIADYAEGMPASVAAVMEMNLDLWIDAITDDPEMAEEAKTFHAESLELFKSGAPA